jgi:hypothetical protein
MRTLTPRRASAAKAVGTELGYGWTIAIDIQTGSMAGSFVAEDNVVELFGACTPL